MRRSVQSRRNSVTRTSGLRVVGLFAGVGGLETGLARAGHEALLLCENDPSATAVLRARLPDIPLHGDIRTLRALPKGTDLVVAGFPCQDLSQAGKTVGIAGARSGLVGEVFRLLERRRVPNILLENVSFMLQLARGKAMSVIVDAIESLGYRWAYRVVDSRCTGVPQRRKRVYFLASRTMDPRAVLFADEAEEPPTRADFKNVACGFYWTEGIRGLGWAVDAVPTLKGGSTIGIPSAPGILLPTGDVVQPNIRDAERMQGFPADWTEPAAAVARGGFRWKLVGNAVTVPVAAWLGHRLSQPGEVLKYQTTPIDKDASWPFAAWNVGDGRVAVAASEWPIREQATPLAQFLKYEPTPLSVKATAGFLARTETSSLRFPDGFLPTLRKYLHRIGGDNVTPRKRATPRQAALCL